MVMMMVLFTMCMCITTATALLDPMDFLALQSIRKSLHDVAGSTFFSTWDFTSDPCDFQGVYCESNKVIALNLGDPRAGSPGLTGHIDPAIGKLSALTEFTVVPGRIIGKIPETLSQLTNLRFVAISRNYLSGEIPAGFGELRNLHTLDLSYNQLVGTIPYTIVSLSYLTNLILCHNHLTGPLPSPFSSTALSRVDLMHNNLTGFIQPDTLPSSVQYLSLGWNKFSGPVDGLLTKLNRLNYLDLSMNKFTGVIPYEIFSYGITHVQLQRNQFMGPLQPAQQVNIPILDLSYNRLSGHVSPMLATVHNLFLNNNRFIGSVPGEFVDRLSDGTIQTLYLQHNYLTGFRMNQTAEIPLSSSLCLMYNCMVPPAQSACPLKAGFAKTRPTVQCSELKG
ncbi:hypothetical protein vseg_003722 [Gypsophila vaccaria]